MAGTGLLAKRPKFERLLAAVNGASECLVSDWDDLVFGEFNDFCIDVATIPTAVTAAGRAFQAATLHQLSYMMSGDDAQDGSSGAGAAWRVLAGIVSDAYRLLPIRILPEADLNADAPLLALRPELEKLHGELQAALEKNSPVAARRRPSASSTS